MFCKRTKNRRAAAVVELAVCLPVIILITLSSIEGASMIFLRQTLVQSSYEAVKAAAKRRGTEERAVERGDAVLATREINEATYAFDYDVSDSANPSADTVDMTPETAPRGTEITVTVSAPTNPNSILSFGPYQDRVFDVSATMKKE